MTRSKLFALQSNNSKSLQAKTFWSTSLTDMLISNIFQTSFTSSSLFPCIIIAAVADYVMSTTQSSRAYQLQLEQLLTCFRYKLLEATGPFTAYFKSLKHTSSSFWVVGLNTRSAKGLNSWQPHKRLIPPGRLCHLDGGGRRGKRS